MAEIKYEIRAQIEDHPKNELEEQKQFHKFGMWLPQNTLFTLISLKIDLKKE